MRCERTGFFITAAERPETFKQVRTAQTSANGAIDALENASGNGRKLNDGGIKPRLDKKRKNLKRLFVAF